MRSENTLLIPAVLCGGAGTRLWPLSRDAYPKQLLALAGPETMLQSTIRRMHGFTREAVDPAGAPMVICNQEHRFLVASQIKDMGVEGASIILEPMGRNTAPALTVAALEAARNGEDPLLLVMPADHVLEDLDAFHRAVSTGIRPALEGGIVTFGIVPDRPETGYGYIQAEAGGATSEGVLCISRFVEKPDRVAAEGYVASGEYCWNSGMFLLKALTWLDAVERLQPAMAAACREALEGAGRDPDFIRLGRDAFSACPSDSIDYAVMENLGRLSEPAVPGLMVALDAGWSDLGAWDSVWKTDRKDDRGNASSGDVILEGTINSLAVSTSRLISCVGMDGVAVVETPDAVLVARMDRAQEVKQVVEALKAAGRPEGSIHRKVHRPWGWYDSLEMGEGFQVKRIAVNPGAVLSLQKHRYRAEHWVVVRGTARVTRDDEFILVNENQSVFIPLGAVHRVENPGETPLEIIEVQLGTYLGEDDIIRLEDKYGR